MIVEVSGYRHHMLSLLERFLYYIGGYYIYS